MKGSNYYTDGNKLISYTTHVANIDHAKREVVKLGYWSKTTSSHINKVARELGYKVTEGKAKSNDESNDESSILRFAGIFAAMTDITSPDKKGANEIKTRIFAALPGISLPENWNELSEGEKEKRLKGVQSIALGK